MIWFIISKSYSSLETKLNVLKQNDLIISNSEYLVYKIKINF